MKDTDLTIELGDTKLNIRVAVLIKTKNGYVFEKNPEGFYFVIGGRVKINESSEQAAKREVFEEVGINLEKVKMRAVIENFFSVGSDKYFHEICFVYLAEELHELNLGSNFKEFNDMEIDDVDLRPEIMKEIIRGDDNELIHVIYKNNR